MPEPKKDDSTQVMMDALADLNKDAMVTPQSKTANPLAKAMRILNAPEITPKRRA